jgi:spore germination protein KC
MKRLSKLVIVIILFIPLVFAGCTPYRELKELAIVEGMGVDINTDGSYLLTFQIFKPMSGGGQNGKQGSSNQTKIIQGTGKSLFDASRNVTLQMGKKLYYSNTRAIIISEDLCKKNFTVLLDFLERNHEVKPEQRILMANGRAEDILKAKNEDGFISAQDIELISINSYNTSKIIDKQLLDIYKDTSMGITDSTLAVISAKKSSIGSSSGGSSGGNSSGGGDNQIVSLGGTAFFNNQKLVGVLNDDETRGLLWILGQVKSGMIVVKPDNSGNVSLEIKSAGSKFSTYTKDGKTGISVDVNFSTSVGEIESSKIKDITNDVITKLIDLQNENVKMEMQSAISKALRQNNADIFGFGLKIFQSNPTAWKKLSESWNTSANMLPVTINVKSSIEHYGLITK